AGPPLAYRGYLAASGLRATGSHHVVLRDALVPSDNFGDLAAKSVHPGPLYRDPIRVATLLHGPIALGLAEGALDDIRAMALSGRKQQRATVAMRDSEIFQYELGRAQAEFRAAQDAVHEPGISRSRELWRKIQDAIPVCGLCRARRRRRGQQCSA